MSCGWQIIKLGPSRTSLRLCLHKHCSKRKVITASSNQEVFGLSMQGQKDNHGWLRIEVALPTDSPGSPRTLIDVPFSLSHCPVGFSLDKSSHTCKVSVGFHFTKTIVSMKRMIGLKKSMLTIYYFPAQKASLNIPIPRFQLELREIGEGAKWEQKFPSDCRQLSKLIIILCVCTIHIYEEVGSFQVCLWF